MIVHDDFWTSISNMQLNFIQHIETILKIHGRAAAVVPDILLSEGGAGEAIRRKLLHKYDVHTLLRLPDRHLLRPGRQGQRTLLRPQAGQRETMEQEKLWIYDLRTNRDFSLKQRQADPRRPGRIRGMLPS